MMTCIVAIEMEGSCGHKRIIYSWYIFLITIVCRWNIYHPPSHLLWEGDLQVHSSGPSDQFEWGACEESPKSPRLPSNEQSVWWERSPRQRDG